ncbi:MAG: putative NADH:ubiquinone reductase (H(+)-translocating) [Parcubacteria group bacterium Gr01-1014_72]|nr:MAG: putative NADH:ubiquinone reductase (H(+)-translocating) [Parcubacteria group bacterium Gr01-1014_72]
MQSSQKRVLIVGGGFGGVAVARALAKYRNPRLSITLVSDKPHLEYYPALYRTATGRSVNEVCIAFTDIFRGLPVTVAGDRIEAIDTAARSARGRRGSYPYDYAVLALGSVPAYFGIPGLPKHSFRFASTADALLLRNRIHTLLGLEEITPPDGAHATIAIIGAGPSGVELAGELASYLHSLKETHGRGLRVLLIEALAEVLPGFSPSVQKRVRRRLQKLGVGVITGKKLEEVHEGVIVLAGETVRTAATIWTAGMRPATLPTEPPLLRDTGGRLVVDEYLRVRGAEEIYAIGDNAATPWSGMAQTAILDANCAAENIIRSLSHKPLVSYRHKKPDYAIPVGGPYAVVLAGGLSFFGIMGWM